MTLALRPYQQSAVEAVESARERGINRALVALPTGGGKTIVFSHLIQRHGGTALILAHREELLKQAADKLAMVAPELAMSIGFVQASRDDHGAPVVCASVPTLARQARLDRLPKRWGLVIVDEAHHATADSYRRILDAIEADQVVGMTATPERADDARLSDVFEELVYARSMLEMIEEGYLANLTGRRVEIDDLDLSKVKSSRGDYQADDLGKAMEEAEAPGQVAQVMAEHAADRKALVFVPTVAVAHATARALVREGVAAAALDGTTESAERAQILADLSSGDLRAVVNVGVLTEGYDEPSVDCVVMACPTKSRIKYVQCVGRGTRLYPGKSDCLVLDLVGVTQTMKLQSLPDLFELDDPPQPEETVTDARERQERERIECEEGEEAARQERKRREAHHAELFNRERMNWQHVGERWAMSIGDGELLVLDPYPDADHWRVLIVRPSGARIVGSGFDLGYAQGAAEETIRKRGRVALADNKAPWRSKPVTPGQRSHLARIGAGNGHKNRGEAADAITLAKAHDQLHRLDRAMARDHDTTAAVAAEGQTR